MILMGKAFLDENPNPTRQEVKEGLEATSAGAPDM